MADPRIKTKQMKHAHVAEGNDSPTSDTSPLYVYWWGGQWSREKKNFYNPYLRCLCGPHPPVDGIPTDDLLVKNMGIAALNSLMVAQPFRAGKRELPDESVSSSFLFTFEVTKEFNTDLQGEWVFYKERESQPMRLTRSNVWTQDNFFTSLVKVLDGQLSSFEPQEDGTYPAEPITAIFNELEIIRFYYSASNHMTMALFAGDFEEQKLKKRVIDPTRFEPYFDKKQRVGVFDYRPGFTKYDLPLIGRILFDETGLAKHGARRVHASSVFTQSKMTAELKPRQFFARTLFPFTGKTTIKATGARVRIEDKNYFLVQRIESCAAPLPVDKLYCYCANLSKRQVDPSLPKNDTRTVPSLTGPGSGEGGVMDTTSNPAANSIPRPSVPDMQRFVGSMCEVVIEQSAEKIPPINPPFVFADSNLVESSPGQTTSGESDAVRQELHDMVLGAKDPQDFILFTKCMMALTRLVPCRISSFPVSPHAWFSPLLRAAVNPFPKIPPKRGRNYLALSFIDDDCRQPRHYLWMRVKVKDSVFHLINPECKDNGKGNLSVLMVWHPGNQALTREAAIQLMMATVRLGRWDASKLNGFKIERFPHIDNEKHQTNLACKIHQIILDSIRNKHK
ncbi:MAG: hypothetical protein PGN26_02830 [Xylophilus ampelinus]